MTAAAILFLAIAAQASPSVPAGGGAAPWARAFDLRRAPPVHAQASYEDARGQPHRLEVWRDHDQLRRDTDGRVQIFGQRTRGGEAKFSVVDRARGLVFSVTRTTLWRLGAFRSFDGLAAMIEKPAGVQTVRPDPAPAGRGAGHACRWWRVESGGSAQRVCWSKSLALPLAVEIRRDGAWHRALAVESVATGPAAADTFAIPHQGLVRLDMDADASPDVD